MKLSLRTFDQGLGELMAFVNDHKLQPEHIQFIVREGVGYKLLFWTKKLKPESKTK